MSHQRVPRLQAGMLRLWRHLRLGALGNIGAKFLMTAALLGAVALEPSSPRHAVAPGRIASDTASNALPAVPKATSPSPELGFSSIAGNRTAVRWENGPSRVVVVRVEDAPNVRGWSPADREIIAEAIRAWEDEGIPVRFVLESPVDSTDSLAVRPAPDVVVRWVDRFERSVSGWTTVTWNEHGEIQRGDVRLALRMPNGQAIPTAQRLTLAMHEFGHVLGLGHSDDPTAIMSTVIYASRIGTSDAASIQRLYGMALAVKQ